MANPIGDFSDFKDRDSGNMVIPDAHPPEAEKFGVSENDSKSVRAPKVSRGSVYGLYPKRMEPKPAFAGVEKRKSQPFWIVGRLKKAKKIISVAGIIAIVLLGAAFAYLITKKNPTVTVAPNLEQVQVLKSDSLKQGQANRPSAGDGAEKEPVLGNAAVNQNLTVSDNDNPKTTTPVLPRRSGSPPTSSKRLRSSSHNFPAVEPNARRTASILLKPVETGTGMLHVHTYPWANMYVDDIFEGTTPTANPIPLTAGEHSLVLKRDGYKPYSGTINIYKGDTTRARIKLEL
jgi:hypothetical protein